MVQGYGEFYHPQTGTKMTSVNRYYVYDVLPEFARELHQLSLIKLLQIGGFIYLC
jgi:hypothetical protein